VGEQYGQVTSWTICSSQVCVGGGVLGEGGECLRVGLHVEGLTYGWGRPVVGARYGQMTSWTILLKS
jgi:hypothetical protein